MHSDGQWTEKHSGSQKNTHILIQIKIKNRDVNLLKYFSVPY